MIGRVFLMELRTGWKGILLFLFIVLIMAGGMPQIFPTLMESASLPLAGEENLELVLPEEKGENLTLSWVSLGENTSYLIVESENITIYPATNIFFAKNNSISIPYNYTGNRYYSVFTFTMSSFNYTEIFSFFTELFTAAYNETGPDSIKLEAQNQLNSTFIGMTQTSKEGTNPFDQMLELDAYKSLTGGRVTTMYEMRGFISLEFFSWWIFLAGLFFAYISVSSLTGDFDGKRLDLIFSTPISRERYIIEKFAALTLVALFVLVVAAGAMWNGIEKTGYTEGLSLYIIFLAVIGSLPMLMVIMAIGFLSAVQFRSTRVGMGIAFLFIMVEFILHTVAQLVESADAAKYATVMYYWDYNSALYDGIFKAAEFGVLLAVTGILLVLAIYVFKKKDIPA